MLEGLCQGLSYVSPFKRYRYYQTSLDKKVGQQSLAGVDKLSAVSNAYWKIGECVLVTQSCLTLQPHGLKLFSPWNSPGNNTGVDCHSPLPNQVSSQTRDQTRVSHIAGRFFTIWASREARKIVSGGNKGRREFLRELISQINHLCLFLASI